MRPTHSIRIDLPETRFYVKVCLWQSPERLKAGAGIDQDESSYGCYEGRPWQAGLEGSYCNVRVHAHVGTIHLCKGNLDSGVIAHECLHCLQDFAPKWNMLVRQTDIIKWEEQQCRWMEYIVSSIESWLEGIKAYNVRCSICCRWCHYASWPGEGAKLICEECANNGQLDT